MITKYLSLIVTVVLAYFISHDVDRFVFEADLFMYSLSHFSVHIALRELFQDKLSFPLYFTADMVIMFGKSFFIHV